MTAWQRGRVEVELAAEVAAAPASSALLKNICLKMYTQSPVDLQT